LLAYLLVFPAYFVLAPLAGLLLASRPATPREWLWIGAAAVGLALSFWQGDGIAAQFPHALALCVTSAFVVLMLGVGRKLVSGALLAVCFGFGATTAWAWLLGTGWQDAELAFAHGLWDQFRELMREAMASPERLEAVRTWLDLAGQGVAATAPLLPALLVLGVLPGLALAWSWYHRLAAEPKGPPPGDFAQFRFSDQLVWLVVVSVAAMLLPLPPQLEDLLGNLALVIAGLYAARGGAVLWGTVQTMPFPMLLALMFGVLLLTLAFLPVVLGGLFALGLADTWLDFRRRLAAVS